MASRPTSSAGEAPRGLRAVRSRAVRKALAAPEIERYLSRGSVDLLVTDQVEALKVRVSRGIEVLERKVKAARQAAYGRAAIDLFVFLLGLALPALHALVASRGLDGGTPGGAALWALAGLTLCVGIAALIDLVRVLRDGARLARLTRDHLSRLEAAGTAEEVLRMADEALAEARAVGAVPQPQA
jgi:hypothetical protein